MEPHEKAARNRGLLWGLVGGTAYGVFIRALAGAFDRSSFFYVMSFSFLFVAPVAIGFLTVWPNPRPSWAYRIVVPWLPILLAIGIVGLGSMEGLICMVMGCSILLPLASVGGVIAGLLRRRRAPAGVALALMPLIVGGVERGIPQPVSYRTVVSTIDMRATPERVWRTIEQVPPIAPTELPDALYLRMGFPRPISATIDGRGVGAMRRATFSGNLVFHETVTQWDSLSVLSFRIAAQTDSIPPTTLDQHVTIGGPYFDVLQGTYALEPLPSGVVRVRLTSRLRVSTHFNFFAGLWADTIMRDIQRTILVVEKKRAEA